MFTGIEHTAIASPDPERLAQWYVEHLGFSVNYRYAGNLFVKAADGSMIEIIPSEGPRAPQTAKTPGLRHLAIDVEDFDAACQRLAAQGVEFFEPPKEVQGNRLVFFNDADGNIVHLMRRAHPI
ncbi:MAG: VOC family protein [Bryobacteraceae bacterium]|jgi:glyoxylase I family protein